MGFGLKINEEMCAVFSEIAHSFHSDITIAGDSLQAFSKWINDLFRIN